MFKNGKFIISCIMKGFQENFFPFQNHVFLFLVLQRARLSTADAHFVWKHNDLQSFVTMIYYFMYILPWPAISSIISLNIPAIGGYHIQTCKLISKWWLCLTHSMGTSFVRVYFIIEKCLFSANILIFCSFCYFTVKHEL